MMKYRQTLTLTMMKYLFKRFTLGILLSMLYILLMGGLQHFFN